MNRREMRARARLASRIEGALEAQILDMVIVATAVTCRDEFFIESLERDEAAEKLRERIRGG